MKLGPVTKLDKRKKQTNKQTKKKKCDQGVMSKDFNVIAIFPIYG